MPVTAARHMPIALRHDPTWRALHGQHRRAWTPTARSHWTCRRLTFDSRRPISRAALRLPEGERIVWRDVVGFMGRADAYATTAVRAASPLSPNVPRPVHPGQNVCVAPVAGADPQQFVEHWQVVHGRSRSSTIRTMTALRDRHRRPGAHERPDRRLHQITLDPTTARLRPAGSSASATTSPASSATRFRTSSREYVPKE